MVPTNKKRKKKKPNATPVVEKCEPVLIFCGWTGAEDLCGRKIYLAEFLPLISPEASLNIHYFKSKCLIEC